MRTYSFQRFYYVLLFVVFFFAFFLRFYHLGNVPAGLNQDETAIGYNAYSILQTGKDEHGVSWPLYFKSFNDYKLPVYIYMTALAESMFGVTAFAVRFSSAFFGSLTIIALYFLTLKTVKNKNIAFLAALFLTINPWHLFFSRIGFEVNVAVALLTFGALFFILAVERKNNIILYVGSLVCFIFSLYCYNITRILAPALFIILIAINRKKFFSLPTIALSLFSVLFLLAELPFILTLGAHSGLQYQTNVLITGGDSKASIVEFRSYMTGLPHIFTALFFNTWVLLFWQYLKNIIASFSTLFFFVSTGNQTGDIGVGNTGMFYLAEFLFIVVASYKSILQKNKKMLFSLLWIIATTLLVSLSAVVPTGTRSFALVIPLTVFSAYGCWEIVQFAKQQKKIIKNTIVVGLVICMFYGFVFFQVSYYTRFVRLYAPQWRTEDQALSIYLLEHANTYQHIIFDKKIDFIYTSLLFYQKYSPLQYQKEAVYEPDQLFTNATKIGKYEFKKIDWTKDLSMQHTLFITEPDNIPTNKAPLHIFSYPTRPVVLSVENKVAQYPYTQPAFVLYSSDNN